MIMKSKNELITNSYYFAWKWTEKHWIKRRIEAL